MFHSRVDYFTITAVTNSICATLQWSRVNDRFCQFSLSIRGTDWPRIVNINHLETLQTNRNYVLLSDYLRETGI